jgi:TolB-like protein/Tfp pilus assembly protein PilF
MAKNGVGLYRNAWLGAVVVIAAIAVGAMATRSMWKARRAPIKSLAVLPLKNLSGDASQDYLADGMTEELIGRLAGIHDLRLISRTSVMRFKDTQLSIPEIAKALDVDAIIEGSVTREGDQIRVHAQLIRASSDEHIWAEEYQREYRSVLALQEDIAGAIAGRVESSLKTPQVLAHARQVDPEAHEAYLKGRYYFNQRAPDALTRSIDFFNQAIAKDPGYAVAYSGLADDYALLGFRGGVPSKDALVRAKAAARRALELDDTLADAHASLAFIAETHEWDWETAEREYKRALDLNPGDARVHHWYAGYLVYTGHIDEGIAEERRARELDPLSLPINNALAGRLLVAGRYDEALDQVKKTLELDAHFAFAHQTLGWVYLNRGQNREALREFHSALELSQAEDVDLLIDLGFADAVTGSQNDARQMLTKIKLLHEKGLAPSGAIGILYGAMGDLDEAFSWLDRAFQERDPELTYIKVPGRRFGPLRRDPRYAELVRRMGLPQ